MLLLLYWLAAALVLARRPDSRRAEWIVAGIGVLLAMGSAYLLSDLNPAFRILLGILQVLAAVVTLAWTAWPSPRRAATSEGMGFWWVYLATAYLLAVQGGGQNAGAGFAGALLALLGVATWLRFERARHGGFALGVIVVAASLQALWEHRGLLAIVQMPLQPVEHAIPFDASLPVPDGTSFLIAGLAVAVLRVATRRTPFAFEPWAWPCLLAVLPWIAMGEEWIGLTVAAVLAVAWVATRTRMAFAVWSAVLLAVPLVRSAEFAAYTIRYPGNRAGQPPTSAESLRLSQHYALSRLPAGEVVSAARLAHLMPSATATPRHIRARDFPALTPTIRPAGTPAWLFYSNNPEQVTEDAYSSPGASAVLARDRVPAGRGRIFASHFNEGVHPRDLVVQFRNLSDRPSRLVLSRRSALTDPQAAALLVDLGLEVWRRFATGAETIERELAAGGDWCDVIPAVLGDAILMADVETTSPLELTVAYTPRGGAPPVASQPARPLKYTQSRGVYLRPDAAMEADFDMDAGGIRLLPIEREPLLGLDSSLGSPRPDRLKGNFGAITHIRLAVRRSTDGAFRRFLAILIPGGGSATALYNGQPRSLPVYHGLVLANQPVSDRLDFAYDYTLPANSFAPLYLLVMPLKI